MNDKDKGILAGLFTAYLIAALVTHLFDPGPMFFFIMAMITLLAMTICAMSDN